MTAEERAVREVLATVERETGPLNPYARIAIERAVWDAIDDVTGGFDYVPEYDKEDHHATTQTR